MNETLGQTIKRLRREKGYTKVELSRKTGLSVAEIRNIETDCNKPRVFNIKKISEALECDFQILYNKINENNF